MFAADVLEWEAKGDSLRRAKRHREAIEAYRTALRHCFQLRGRDVRSCNEIREKIWSVEVDLFEVFWTSRNISGIDEETASMARADMHPGMLEQAAARLWACGAMRDAERLIDDAVRRGAKGSGEFLHRLADRWQQKHEIETAGWLRTQASRLRGQPAISAAAAAAAPR